MTVLAGPLMGRAILSKPAWMAAAVGARRAGLVALAGSWRGRGAVRPKSTAAQGDREEIYVDSPATLRQLIGHCEAADKVAVDTEFIQFPSLVPKLQLIQVATPNAIAVVDYQAVRRDGFKELVAAIAAKECVLHASTVDMRLIGHFGGQLPSRVFDTQIASGFVGLGQRVGLGTLLSDLLGVDVDKSQSMTDWSKRPLSTEQISYAMNDVRYLLQVRDRLHEMLAEKNRLHMFEEEMAKLSEPATYRPPEASECWRTIRRTANMEGRELAVVRELAAWRDAKARDTNTWHALVARDDLLCALAVQKPITLQQIKNIQGVKPLFAERYGVEILARVKKGLNTPESEWPVRADVDETLSDSQSCLLYCLQAWVRAKAAETGIAGYLLVQSNDELRRIAIHPAEELENLDIPVLKGWRREVVGRELLDFKAGKTMLRFDTAANALQLS